MDGLCTRPLDDVEPLFLVEACGGIDRMCDHLSAELFTQSPIVVVAREQPLLRR